MALLDLLKPNPCKEIEAYFKAVVLPQLKRYEPYTASLNWSAAVEEDDRIRPLADRRTYLVKGKKFKPGKIYSTTYKRPTGDKSACYLIEDIGAAYSIEKFKNLPNVYAYAKSESDVFLFVWKDRR